MHVRECTLTLLSRGQPPANLCLPLMSNTNLAIKFENITATLSNGEDMKLKPGVKGAARLKLRHCTAVNFNRKRVKSDLFF